MHWHVAVAYSIACLLRFTREQEVHILSRLLYRNKQQHKHASAFKGLKRLHTEVQALQVEQLEKLHTHAESLIRSIQVER